jgi:hypothetical protein
MAWNFSTMQEALGAALGTLAGSIDVVWGEQAICMVKPRLVLDWVSETPVSPMSEDRPSNNGTDGDHDTIDQITAVLQLGIYTDATQGTGAAYDCCIQLRSALGRASGRAAIAASGFVVVDRAGVRNASALVDPRIEGRAIFEITLAYAIASTENLSWVDTVETTATLT